MAGLGALGAEYLPMRGPLTVTVPGAAQGWCDLSERFGKLPLAQVLAPAIAYATEGFPVTEVSTAHRQRPTALGRHLLLLSHLTSIYSASQLVLNGPPPPPLPRCRRR